MITTTPELAAWMDSARAGVRIDLYTLTLSTGQVLRWSGGDANVLLPDGRLFVKGPLLTRGRVELRAGIEVDEMSVEVMPTPNNLVAGQPLLRFAREGGMRGVELQLDWAYFDLDRVFKGVISKFVGRGSPTEFEQGRFRLGIKSDLERLLVMVPRDVYQPTCLNSVYDAACAASRTANTNTGTVTAASSTSQSTFTDTGMSRPAGYFDKGVLTFTTGLNAGLSRTVRGYAAGVYTFALPLPRPIAVGDLYAVLPGCDGTQATCASKFNNLLRFRGQPYIPAPEVAT